MLVNQLAVFLENRKGRLKELAGVLAKEKIQFLLDKGLSNSFIAKICNYHPSTLSKWLSGKISVSEKLEKNINQNLLDFVEELQKIKGED